MEDTHRKPIADLITFREVISLYGNTCLEGTLLMRHQVATHDPTLDHRDSSSLYDTRRNAQRMIRNAIDDKVFGDARLVLLRLRDEVDTFIDDAPNDNPGAPVRIGKEKRIRQLMDDLKEALA
jgi:hypothetical protein